MSVGAMFRNDPRPKTPKGSARELRQHDGPWSSTHSTNDVNVLFYASFAAQDYFLLPAEVQSGDPSDAVSERRCGLGFGRSMVPPAPRSARKAIPIRRGDVPGTLRIADMSKIDSVCKSGLPRKFRRQSHEVIDVISNDPRFALRPPAAPGAGSQEPSFSEITQRET